MSEENKVQWACARCTKRKKIENVNPDPVVLQECDFCHIENWVRPVGHAGKGASGPLMPEPKNPELEGLPVYKEVEVVEVLKEAPEPEPELEPLPEVEDLDKQAKIEALKAQLAELQEDE